MKVVYQTNDGKEFLSKEEAEKHEHYLSTKKELTAEVLEDIQKILVKLQNVNEVSKYGTFDEDESAKELHLEMIKRVLRDLASADDTQDLLQIESYYNSSC